MGRNVRIQSQNSGNLIWRNMEQYRDRARRTLVAARIVTQLELLHGG